MQNPYTENFDRAYSKLNKAQKNAVDTIEGPVLVNAGPGTGKTQILALRIANILRKTQTSPQNILCTTYTDAGAQEMRKRISHFIGSATADKITICTIHAFCNNIIQENSELFEYAEMADILDEYFLYKKLIDNLPSNSPIIQIDRENGSIYRNTKTALSELFTTVKKEYERFFPINKVSVITRLKEYSDNLENHPYFLYKTEQDKKNSKRKKIDEERKRILKTVCSLKAYGQFQTLLQEKHLYTFDDMVLWVHKAFQENEELLLNYQERYQYVLMDEFQDTNGTQFNIIQMLMNYWEDSPNLFAVGDKNQSIYRFQGADVHTFDTFQKRYPETQNITLTENYRSTSEILKYAHQLILNNYSADKPPPLLNAHVNYPNIPPALTQYATTEDEYIGTAEHIKKLYNKGIPYEKIAVLFKTNNTGHTIGKYLRAAGIPFYFKQQKNLLEEPIIQNIITILRYITNTYDTIFTPNILPKNYLFFQILLSDFSPHTVREISDLSINLYRTRKNIADFFTDNPDLENKFPIFKTLETLSKDYHNTSPYEMLALTLHKMNIIKRILHKKDPNQKLFLLNALQIFNEFYMRQFEKKRIQTVPHFLTRIVDIYTTEKLNLPLTTEHKEGVFLNTLHSSKGMEFDYVFFIQAGSKNFKNQIKNNKENRGIYLSKSYWKNHYFPKEILNINEAISEDHLAQEEQRRLFYVGMTRAKKELSISYTEKTSDEIAKIFSPVDIATQEKNPVHIEDTNTLLTYKSAVLTPQSNPITTQTLHNNSFIFKNIVKEFLTTFRLSAASLYAYQECAIAFYFEKVLHIPTPPKTSIALEQGNTLHHVLKHCCTEEKLLPLTDLQEILQKYLTEITQIPEKEKEIITANTTYLLPKLYEDYLTSEFSKTIQPLKREREKHIRTFLDSETEFPIEGRFDELQEFQDTYIIIDYKIAKYDKKKFLNKNNKVIPKYRQQALFYKILLESKIQTKKVSKIHFPFFHKDKIETAILIFEPSSDDGTPPNNSTCHITPEEITNFKTLIRNIWTELRNNNFINGCKQEKCIWCQYIKREDEK